jgi:hypothetical protein
MDRMEWEPVPALNEVENMKNQTLHEALMRFPLAETGGRYTFLDRLCRENNWSTAEGQRAIGEYKQFVYLARVSPTPVTPPPAVDQVWHLHLLYTRSYWEELCQGVLGRPLHHGPTAGGEEENEKFGNWYEKTRILYREEFDAAPPADLWPVRFSPEKRYRWTDLARNWIIPKPSFGAVLPSVFPLLIAKPGEGFGLFVVLLGVLALIIGVSMDDEEKRKRRRDGDGSSGSGCGAFGGGSDCGDSSGGDCGGEDGGGGDGGGGCGGGGCGGGCGGGD